jgi:hypothetical protein
LLINATYVSFVAVLVCTQVHVNTILVEQGLHAVLTDNAVSYDGEERVAVITIVVCRTYWLMRHYNKPRWMDVEYVLGLQYSGRCAMVTSQGVTLLSTAAISASNHAYWVGNKVRPWLER